MRKKLFVVVMFLVVGLGTGFAQQGFLKGKITDKSTGEELVGAAVVVDGTTTGTITDFTGEYMMPALKAGSYTIRVQYISYDPMVFNDVVIKAGEETVLNIHLSSATMDIEEVAVVAKANRESENMLLMEQKKAVIAGQAIGAQELSRKGVSDAEGAVTKVSGISKQEGVKNVFVRGLGDRYNTTTLNGFPVPSEDPEYKNISLDFFSSDIIQAVSVNKVFGSQNNGNVAGANINILSKELTGDFSFGVDASTGVNTQTISEDFYSIDGVNSFGFANKTAGPTRLENRFIADYTFANKIDPSKSGSFKMNSGFKLSGGKKYLLGVNKNPFQFYLVGSYNSSYNYINGQVRNTTTIGTIWQDQTYDKYEQTTTHMVMANADYTTSLVHLYYNAFVIHNDVQSLGNYFGKESESFQDSPTETGLLRRQQVNDNNLFVNQLKSNWDVDERTTLDAGLSLNIVKGNEPDRRINYLSLMDDNLLKPTGSTGRHQRYFSALSENDFNASIGLSRKLSNEKDNKSVLNIGYNGRFVNRDFEAIEYDHEFSYPNEYSVSSVSLDDYFNSDNLTTASSDLAVGNFRLDRNLDKYSVSNSVHSGYGELIYQLSPKIIGIAGVRLDKVLMNVDYNVNRGGDIGRSTIDESFVLPSLNLKYSINDKHSLRLGVSKTYTLPQAKEIAPFRYVDVSFKSQGNSNLQPATNYNIDVKWDFYLSRGELITLTGFYKLIQDPISRVEKQSAGNYLTYDNITDKADVAGVELEVRKNIFMSTNTESEKYSKFSLGLNTSYISTHVSLDPANDFTNTSSELEGASPFLLNVDLSHNIKSGDKSFTNSIVFNYFSDRIYTVGMNGYQDVNEKSVPTLDFISQSSINKHMAISFKAKNLLNPYYTLTRKGNSQLNDTDPIILSKYKKGINISVGLTYNF